MGEGAGHALIFEALVHERVFLPAAPYHGEHPLPATVCRANQNSTRVGTDKTVRTASALAARALTLFFFGYRLRGGGRQRCSGLAAWARLRSGALHKGANLGVAHLQRAAQAAKRNRVPSSDQPPHDRQAWPRTRPAFRSAGAAVSERSARGYHTAGTRLHGVLLGFLIALTVGLVHDEALQHRLGSGGRRHVRRARLCDGQVTRKVRRTVQGADVLCGTVKIKRYKGGQAGRRRRGTREHLQ